MKDALNTYQAKRNFAITPEPAGGDEAQGEQLSFVIQKHWASRLHYDFRLELDGTMKSWAVPKGPSYDSRDKRMAVQVEDHPVAYASFEGTIPEKQYGAGKVIIWDKGTWAPQTATPDARQALADGNLKFTLHGHKMHGNWVLVRMKGKGEKQPAWLLIKEKDDYTRPALEYSVVDELPDSVKAMPKRKKAVAHKAAPASDKPASTIVRERPQAVKANKEHAMPADKPAASIVPASLKITNPDRVIDKDSGATKIELVCYYALVGKLMLVHLRGRPVSLVRAPAGVGGELFFQKHAEVSKMPGVKQLAEKLDPEHPPMLEVASAQGLLSAAQWNVVEFHTQNALATAYDTPNRMVFDLDPGKGVGWPAIQESAVLLRAFLTELGLPAFLKTSGGKGLHVVVPIRPKHDWDTVKAFSQAIVTHMAELIPQRFVVKSGPANRVGKIFIDYLRNGRGATTVAAWSVRTRPGLGISVPLAWEELDKLKAADQWTVANVHSRLDVGNTPWKGYARSAKGIATAMKKLGFEVPT